jgi:serine phosphatase RsbU (regulator of sigma subunit)
MQEEVFLFRLKNLCATDPAWRLRVPDGTWICPYCAETTNVSMVDSNGAHRPVDELVRDFRAHFTRCYHYSQNPEKWKTVDEIRAALGEKSRQEQEVRAISERMQSDRVFGFDDGRGHWICPFCEQAIPTIDVSTPFARMHAAPAQALAHLKSGVCTYRGGELEPGKSPEDMQAVVKKITGVGDEEAEKEGASPSDSSGVLETLKGELDELRSHLGQSKKIHEDLERAKKAQQRMLPSKVPEIPGYEIDVYFCGCEEVSGDFYDFVTLPDGSVGIIMGDISGHGVDAGIVMAMAKKAFSMRAKSGADPVTVAAQANADIYPELDTATFITAIYGVLDPNQHVFRFVRCGHTFPVHYHASSRTVEDVASDGVVLGSVRDPMFSRKTKLREVALEPGDSVTIFTDGITEAMTAKSEEFGPEATNAALERHGVSTAKGIIEGLIGAIHIFTAGHPQEDDETLIVVRRQA